MDLVVDLQMAAVFFVEGGILVGTFSSFGESDKFSSNFAVWDLSWTFKLSMVEFGIVSK